MKQYVYYVVFETYEGNRSDKIVSLTEKISSDRSINDLKSAVMEGTYGSLNVILHNFYLLRVEGEEEEKKSKYEIADEVLNEYMNTENAPSSFGDFLYKKINRR